MLNDITSLFLGTRIVLFILTLSLIARLVQLRYQRGLHQFNGPFLASFTDLWRYFSARFAGHEVPARALQRKYGDVVRIGPNALLFNDPQAVSDIYGAGKDMTKVSVNC